MPGGFDGYQRIREQVWVSYLDSKLFSEYWRSLAGRYQKYDTWIKVLIFILSSSTTANILLEQDLLIGWKVASTALSILALIITIINWTDVVSKSSALYSQWLSLGVEYERIWSDLSEENYKELGVRYFILKNREVALTMLDATMPISNRLLNKAQNKVNKSMGLINRNEEEEKKKKTVD